MSPAAAVEVGQLVQVHPDQDPVRVTKVSNATPTVGWITWNTESHGEVIVGGAQRVTIIDY